MDKVILRDKSFSKYISREEIDVAVEKIAKSLNDKFKDSDCKNPPLFISVMYGAYMFTSDLMKKINFLSDISFIKASSYCGTERVSEPIITWCSNTNFSERDVIILDEIIDSGHTMSFLKRHFLEKGAKTVTVATLIHKPKTVKAKVTVDVSGIEMDDNLFLVGYGLDYDELGRSLSDIYILDNE